MSAPAMSEAGNANSRDTGVRGYSIDKFFDASTGEEGKKKSGGTDHEPLVASYLGTPNTVGVRE